MTVADGAPPDPREIADLLWLDGLIASAGAPGGEDPVPAAPGWPGDLPPPPSGPAGDRGSGGTGPETDDQVGFPSLSDIFFGDLSQSPETGNRPPVPGADPKLPDTIGHSGKGLRRALVHLRQAIPSTWDTVLDEEATAERLADGALVFPAYRPAAELRWDMMLVVDTSPTMAVWADIAPALVSMFEKLGVFRDVRVMYLDTDVRFLSELRPRVTRAGGAGRSPLELIQPSGRRIVWLLSDGLGTGWRTGLVSRLLWLWSRRQPVAVVTPLPTHLWHYTGLRNRRVRMSYRAGPRHAGFPWRFARPWERARASAGPGPRESASPVPVLELRREALEPWAEGLSGQAEWIETRAILTRPTDGAADPGGASVEPGPVGEGAAGSSSARLAPRQVALFRAAASPAAFDLATHLAAAPLTWPALRLVLGLVPAAGRGEVAELFMHGLLRPAPAPPRDDPMPVSFDFVLAPGLREELLAHGRGRETKRVLRTVGDRLGDRIPAVRHLRQAVDAPALAPIPDLTAENRPFLAVEQAALAALSEPAHLARARTLAERLATSPRDPSRAPDETQKVLATLPSVTASQEPTVSPPSMRSPNDRPGGEAVKFDAEGAALTSTTAETSTVGKPRTRRPSAVWGNVPQRNRYFTGRAALLRELHTRLAAGPTVVLPEVRQEALHGMAGVGKSQLAIEYVYRHQADYDVIWWIPSEHSAQIGQALVELARRLDLETGNEANLAVPAVREALRRGEPYDNWLLVFDNAEDPRAVREYFPQGGNGKIIVTSRNIEWSQVNNPLEVNVFERSESKDLLRLRDPGLSDGDADRIAEALGDLPLAIEQAATWRAETAMSPDEYLRLFEEEREELLGTEPPLDYELPVRAAWNMSLKRLTEGNLAALRLLQVCSFFAPEPISRQILRRGRTAKIVPELDKALRDPFRLSELIRDINRYALARVDHRTGSIQMHRLVQQVLRGAMTDDERETMLSGAHALLVASDPDDPSSPEFWPQYAELFPHVIATGAIESSDAFVRDLVVNEVEYLYKWGDHLGSLEVSRQAHETWTRLLGDRDPHTLRIAGWLGWMSYVVGRYDDSRAVNAKLLELCEEVHGPSHTETLEALGNVAGDHMVAGNFADALRYSEERYQRALRVYGPDEQATLDAAHNVGFSLRLLGRFREAAAIDGDSWERRTQLVGEDEIDSLRTLGAMVLDQRELGDYLGARMRHEDQVARMRAVVGNIDDHPELLRAASYLAVSRRKAGDHEEALALARDVQRRFTNRYDEDYPRTIAASLGLSIDLRHNGELDEARELCDAALRRFRRAFGSDHPHTHAALVNLAVIARLSGDPQVALDLDQVSWRGLRERLGADHPSVLIAATNLASDHYGLGRFQEAHDLDVATLERSRRALGDEHPSTLACQVNLALDLRALGRSDEADELRVAAVTTLTRVLGKDHPATLGAVGFVRADCDVDPIPL